MEIVYVFETHLRVDNPDHDNDEAYRYRKRKSVEDDPLDLLSASENSLLETIKSGLDLPEGLVVVKTSPLEVVKI